MVPILLEGVRKQFGPTVAVDDVDLTIAAGERCFLLGPSGCGKTTLLRMVAGFVEPTAGRICFGDQDVTRVAPDQRETGMVFQGYALWPHMTVRANVGFGLEVKKISAVERRRRVDDMLDAVGLADLADRRPGALSGGQQQRVALARALVVEPRVLLLDEPLANLDAALRVELRRRILELCRRTGTTAIYVTHDQAEALTMADRIGVLRGGKLLQVGSPQALYERPGSRFVAEFLGRTNLFGATVAGVERRKILVESSVGRFEARPDEGEPFAVTPGDCVCVSIRPESWRRDEVSDDGATDHVPNRVRVRCIEAAFLGASVEHRCRTHTGETLHVTLPTRQRLTTDQNASLSVDPRDVVVLAERETAR